MFAPVTLALTQLFLVYEHDLKIYLHTKTELSEMSYSDCR